MSIDLGIPMRDRGIKALEEVGDYRMVGIGSGMCEVLILLPPRAGIISVYEAIHLTVSRKVAESTDMLRRWNGDLNAPTFYGSILLAGNGGWHGFVQDGHLRVNWIGDS